jgi:hypothetical protein
MDWRLAKALVQMRSELDTNFPKRDRESDGSIGDARHAAKSSDHNPWVHDHAGQPIVTAIDVDRDITNSFHSRDLAEWLRLRRDPRIKYVISNAQMFSAYPTGSRKAWEWGPYTQANKHFEHVHISVSDKETLFDSQKPWTIASALTNVKPEPAPPHKPAPLPVTAAGIRATLRLGSAGPDVGYLQRMLGGIKADNDFGPKTQLAVKAFQKKAGIEQTGVVDQPTWAALIE